MRRVFVDTSYWIAIINPRDQWHVQARQLRQKLGDFQGMTSDLVLVEVGNYFSAYGPNIRTTVSRIIQAILDDPRIEMVHHTEALLRAALSYYASRSDKSYSLTDCTSMVLMREHGLNELLTNDHHFAQEGFVPLLK